MRRDNAAFTRLGFGKRYAVAFGKMGQRFAGAGVFHPAAADDQRLTAGFNCRHRIRQLCGAGRTAVKAVYPTGKEGLRIIPGFALDILRQTERDRTGFRRVG